MIVRGTGQATSIPDRAEIRAVVDGEGATRDQAYRQAAEAAGAVDTVLSAHHSALDRVTTAALTVQPKSRWKKGESIRTGWRAVRTTTIEVIDFGHLGDLFAELAGAGAAVSGPLWRLDPENAVHSEVRRLAASDARRRAEDYAGALGLSLESVAWIAEPGLRVPSGGESHPWGPAPSAGAAMPMSTAGTGDDVIDVAPKELSVTASVEIALQISSAGPQI